MASDDHKAAYDDIDIRTLAVIGTVGSILVFVAIIAVQVVYFRYEKSELDRKVVDAPISGAEDSLARQRSRLEVAGEGAEPGERSVPIEQAMAAVLDDYRRRQSDDAGRAATNPEPEQTGSRRGEGSAEARTPEPSN